VSVIESGSRWTHVIVRTSEADPDLTPLVAVRDVVNAGRLGLYAETEEERAFLANNAVSILSAPVFAVAANKGYNAGNALIGL
jgi:hypothetical protein